MLKQHYQKNVEHILTYTLYIRYTHTHTRPSIEPRGYIQIERMSKKNFIFTLYIWSHTKDMATECVNNKELENKYKNKVTEILASIKDEMSF